MTTLVVVLAAGILVGLSGLARAIEPSPEDALRTLRPEHPRLFMTADDMAAIKKRLADGDDLLAKCYGDVIKHADELLDKPAIEYKLLGPRLLGASRECTHRVYGLGLAWRLTGREEYAKAACKNLLDVCEFPSWNPSHFLDVAEMCNGVGVGYDWLFDYFDESTRTRIHDGLMRHGLTPGLEAYRTGKDGWWVNVEHNWNQVCNGGLIIAALAVAETDPAVAGEIISNAVRALPHALASYAPDGAWGEGLSYWHYATSFTVNALATLKSALGTDFGLSDAQGLDKAGFFPLQAISPAGRYASFSDIHSQPATDPPHGKWTSPVMFWLARRYNRPELATVAYETLRDRPANPIDLIWYGAGPQLAAVAKPLPLDAYFRGPVEIAFFRSDAGPDAVFASLKAGYNRVNHAHLDLGAFEFDAMGLRWARDLGSDDYNLPGYWEASTDATKRWTYYRISTSSHNVVTLDDQNQPLAATSKFTAIHCNEANPRGVVDLTSAYATKATRVSRGLALVGERRGLLVQDELTIAQPCKACWGMTTDAEIHTAGATAELKMLGKTIYARLLAPASAAFTVESAEQEPPQAKNEGVRRLTVRLDVPIGDMRIAVLLTPDRDLASPELMPLGQW